MRLPSRGNLLVHEGSAMRMIDVRLGVATGHRGTERAQQDEKNGDSDHVNLSLFAPESFCWTIGAIPSAQIFCRHPSCGSR